jgi:multidrug efflux pump subunit AcrA (membrane-fusion protein)
MKLNLRWLILIAVLFILPLSACAPEAPTEEEEKPVQLEPITGTDLNRITLTEKAAERLGLETVTVVTKQVDGAERLIIPYAALLYDPSGQAWVYVNDGPLVFVRQTITVDSIDGDQVILSEGPQAGTNVVTLGATELFGSEEEFEEE